MPTVAFTPDTVAGLALGGLFALVCLRSLSRGVQWYVALAWIPVFQVATLSGSEFRTGLMQVEWLATILIAVWLLRQRPGHANPIVATRFNGPLLWLIPLSAASLVAGFLGLDPLIDASHVKLPVSVGQVALFAWPIGVYLVVASSLATTDSIRRTVDVMTLLAIPAVALPFLPARWRPYAEWSVYFALAVSPFCFASSLRGRSLAMRAGLLAVAAAPIVYGAVRGKALWYVAGLAGWAVVAALRARRALVVLVPLAVGLYLLAFVPLTGSWIPGRLQGFVAEETAQQSLGGRAGRYALAVDAIKIWSHYPLFGVGPGNNYPYMIHYSVIGTAHGQYMNILLELGLVGLGCYLAFVAAALRTGLELLKSVRNEYHELIVLGWLGLFAGLAVVGGLLGDFTLPSIRNDGLHTLSWYYQQWVWLGLLAAVKRIEAR